VRLVVLVSEKPVREAESVVLLRAPGGDWDSAFERALTVGRGLERNYVNEDGEPVRWRLRNIRTLDELGTEIADGREVFFKADAISSDRVMLAELRPEETRPGQTGV
jgi:hypothetical protein